LHSSKPCSNHNVSLGKFRCIKKGRLIAYSFTLLQYEVHIEGGIGTVRTLKGNADSRRGDQPVDHSIRQKILDGILADTVIEHRAIHHDRGKVGDRKLHLGMEIAESDLCGMASVLHRLKTLETIGGLHWVASVPMIEEHSEWVDSSRQNEIWRAFNVGAMSGPKSTS